MMSWIKAHRSAIIATSALVASLPFIPKWVTLLAQAVAGLPGA